MDVEASVWEEADITPTTLEEEEEFRDETDAELTQTLEEVSYTLPSVADLKYLSRILIFVHPGSRIPDPKTATKERGEKKLVVLPFL